MNTSQLLLIDLSGIAHQIWHVSGNEPDPSHVSTQVIARVRALATEHPHAAVCCDAGKSFRCDIDPAYKANRDTENRAPLRHQMDVACETLKRDGFAIWRAPGFEADDIIATATAEALKIDGATVLIASSDKDLLQLVNDRVTAKSLTNGNLMDPAMVFGKLGVHPHQMLDYLCLVGDTSDNITGAKGIGGVIAARLLTEHGSIQAIYDKMAKGVVPGLTPSVRASLTEFADRWPTVRSLIALRVDVPIPFAEIAAERTAPPMEEEAEMDEDRSVAFTKEPGYPQFAEASAPRPGPVPFERGNDANDKRLPFGAVKTPAQDAINAQIKQRVADREKEIDIRAEHYAQRAAAVPCVPIPVVAEFSQQLEPRTMPEAIQLAKYMFESRLFSAYGTPQAVLATVLAGRELGIQAMASLRAFHIIEGKPTMSAGIIQSLVLKSGKASYFRCSERTDDHATFVTKRGDDPEMALTFTVAEARRAFGFDATPEKDRPALEAKWLRSGWGKNPADNCVARASSKLARLVYPDVVSGLYAPEEME